VRHCKKFFRESCGIRYCAVLHREVFVATGAARALSINEWTMRKYVAGDAEVPRTVEQSSTRLRIDKRHVALVAELDGARSELNAPFSRT
jgi:hypothetical protein